MRASGESQEFPVQRLDIVDHLPGAEAVAAEFVPGQRQPPGGVGIRERLDNRGRETLDLLYLPSVFLEDLWNIGNGSADGHDHSGHHSVLLENCGLRYLDTIAWKKTGANFGIPRNCHIRRNRLYYPAFGWEALLVYQKPGDMPKMSEEGLQYMASYQTNVWEVPAVTRQLEQYGHPAVCPVEIPYRALLAYSLPGATVLDPFGGSGTTLIAAEKAGRKALLMEVSPRFCDMSVRRWERFSGQKATRLNS